MLLELSTEKRLLSIFSIVKPQMSRYHMNEGVFWIGSSTLVLFNVRGRKSVMTAPSYSITSQVTDTETATYIHTLTVTGRLVGEYQCSVSNIRTLSGSSRTLTVGKRPETLHVFLCACKGSIQLGPEWELTL